MVPLVWKIWNFGNKLEWSGDVMAHETASGRHWSAQDEEDTCWAHCKSWQPSVNWVLAGHNTQADLKGERHKGVTSF